MPLQVFFLLKRINNMSSGLLQQLKDLINQYPEVKQELFLMSENCPAGMMACNPETQNCPDDDDTNHAIYTSKGFKCYTREGMENVFDDKKIAFRVKISHFITNALKIIKELDRKVNDMQCPELSSAQLCGLKKNCIWNEDKCNDDLLYGLN